MLALFVRKSGAVAVVSTFQKKIWHRAGSFWNESVELSAAVSNLKGDDAPTGKCCSNLEAFYMEGLDQK